MWPGTLSDQRAFDRLKVVQPKIFNVVRQQRAERKDALVSRVAASILEPAIMTPKGIHLGMGLNHPLSLIVGAWVFVEAGKVCIDVLHCAVEESDDCPIGTSGNVNSIEEGFVVPRLLKMCLRVRHAASYARFVPGGRMAESDLPCR